LSVRAVFGGSPSRSARGNRERPEDSELASDSIDESSLPLTEELDPLPDEEPLEDDEPEPLDEEVKMLEPEPEPTELPMPLAMAFEDRADTPALTEPEDTATESPTANRGCSEL